MRCFGLTPDTIAGRSPTRAVELSPARSLGHSIGYGAVAFAAVSLLAYSIFAFRLIRGTVPLYTSTAIIYLGLTGVVLSRLVGVRGITGRFSLLFATAFLAYAIAWCVFWFGLRGKHLADLWGSAVGLTLMAALLRSGFGQRGGDFLAMVAVLFGFHTLGYYLGQVLHDCVRGAPGRMLWGLGHGLGFGAGLGYVLHQCQVSLRQALTAPGR